MRPWQTQARGEVTHELISLVWPPEPVRNGEVNARRGLRYAERHLYLEVGEEDDGLRFPARVSLRNAQRQHSNWLDLVKNSELTENPKLDLEVLRPIRESVEHELYLVDLAVSMLDETIFISPPDGEMRPPPTGNVAIALDAARQVSKFLNVAQLTLEFYYDTIYKAMQENSSLSYRVESFTDSRVEDPKVVEQNPHSAVDLRGERPELRRALALEHLKKLTNRLAEIERERDRVVAHARHEGLSWRKIGEVVGITGQAAYRRWDDDAKEKHRRYAHREDLDER